MGGMGFIELNKAACMLTVLINTHMLMAAQRPGGALLLFVVGLRVRRRQADDADVARCASRTPTRHARRRLWLGEAVQRAHVPSLHRGLRPATAWPAITTCTGRRAPTTAAARRPGRRCAAR
jgi:hypothetical protein